MTYTFECLSCGGTTLDEVRDKVASTISSINDSGMEYKYINNDVIHYECSACGYILFSSDDNDIDIDTPGKLIKWLKEQKQIKSDHLKKTYNGLHCPSCGSEDIEGDSIDPDGASEGTRKVSLREQEKSVKVSCKNCNCYWYEVLKVVGFTNLTQG